MTSAEYISLLCETLLNFQRDGTLCDVIIKARNGAVHAHSAVLAASNLHLRQTLTDQFEMTSSDSDGRFVYQFDISNCSLAAIISVLQSVYSGKHFSSADPECQRTMKIMGFSCSQEASESQTTWIKSSNELSQSLLELQENGILCDVTVNAGNGSINAHSAILAAANPSIRSLFETQAADVRNQSGRVHYQIDLHDFSLDSIVASLQSMYVGKVDGVNSIEEKERFLKLTALGFGIPHTGVADTTTGQSSADVRVQCSTTSRTCNTVFRKRFQEMKGSKSNSLESGVTSEMLDTSQVTSSDEAISTMNADSQEFCEEVHGVILYEKLDDINSTEINYGEQQLLENNDNIVFDGINNVLSATGGAAESNVEHSSYVFLDPAHEPLDCISDDMYIGCAIEETVEIKEEVEEPTIATFVKPNVQTRRPKPESILILPNSATRKRKDNDGERFRYSNFNSPSQNLQYSGSKRGRPAAVTVIDFQQVKAAENLNRALRANQNKKLIETEGVVTTAPLKRYYLASKPNSVVSPQQLQQPRSSSGTNQVSVLLPAIDRRVQSPREFDKMSIVKIAGNSNMISADSQTKKAVLNHRHNESSMSMSNPAVGKFGPIRSTNMNFPNYGTDSRSLLLPMGRQIKTANRPFVADRNDGKQTNVSTTVLRITPKGNHGVRVEEKPKYARGKVPLQEFVEMESRNNEDIGLDKDGFNEAERDGNDESDHKGSCRKRKTTVPVKNIHATTRSKVEAKEELSSVNKVTYDPPCTEVEVSTSTDIRYAPNSRRYSATANVSSAESCQSSGSVEYSGEQSASLDEQKLFGTFSGNTVKDEPNTSTGILQSKSEGLHVVCPVPEDVKESISVTLNADYLSDLNIKKSDNSDNVEEIHIEEVLYSISEDMKQVENSGEYCENEGAPLDEQTEEEEIVEEVGELEGTNETTCKYCEKTFDWPTELSVHMTLHHKCTECSHEFKQTSNLRKHVRIHHNNERTHECPVCGKGFPFRSALKDHIRVHEDTQENQSMYSCDQCAKVFTRVSGLRRHKKVDHSDVLAYECPKCDKRYAYQCNLNNHMMTHSALKPFTCETCGLGFKQNSNLLKHMRTQHNKCSKCTEPCTCIPKPAYECSTCGKSCGGRTQLRVHQRVHSGEKPEVCDLCGTAFQHKSNLMKHRIKHGDTKPYVCSFCTRGFYSNHSLQSHMRLHTGESPHQCDVCGKRFCTRNGLQVHSVLHGDQREFVCGTCGKAFAQLGNLNKHLAIHTGARPFPCDQCTMAFVDSSALRRHIVLHTRERNFACPTCGRTFMYLTSLRAHKLTHEETKQHVCKICSKAFRQKAGYLRHLKIHNENRDCEEVILKPGEYIVYLTE